MAKSNKHKLLHSGLVGTGVLLFVIALWAIVVPHYTCKDGWGLSMVIYWN